MGNKLYVGNLSYNTTEGDLQTMFSQAGTVQEVAIVLDRMTNQSRGFGFVTMASNDDASKAINMFHGKDVDGRTLVVNEARPPAPREGGFGGGAGGRSSGGGGRSSGGGVVIVAASAAAVVAAAAVAAVVVAAVAAIAADATNSFVY